MRRDDEKMGGFRSAWLSWALDAQFPQNRIHPFFKPRQVVLNHTPCVIEINAQILVHQHVAETGNVAPRHIGVRGLQGLRNALTRFGQGLKVAQDGVLNQGGILVFGLPAGGVLLDTIDALADVDQIQPVTFITGRPSSIPCRGCTSASPSL